MRSIIRAITESQNIVRIEGSLFHASRAALYAEGVSGIARKSQKIGMQSSNRRNKSNIAKVASALVGLDSDLPAAARGKIHASPKANENTPPKQIVTIRSSSIQ